MKSMEEMLSEGIFSMADERRGTVASGTVTAKRRKAERGSRGTGTGIGIGWTRIDAGHRRATVETGSAAVEMEREEEEEREKESKYRRGRRGAEARRRGGAVEEGSGEWSGIAIENCGWASEGRAGRGEIFLRVILPTLRLLSSHLVAASSELRLGTCERARSREKISARSWRDAIENLRAKRISPFYCIYFISDKT